MKTLRELAKSIDGHVERKRGETLLKFVTDNWIYLIGSELKDLKKRYPKTKLPKYCR